MAYANEHTSYSQYTCHIQLQHLYQYNMHKFIVCVCVCGKCMIYL